MKMEIWKYEIQPGAFTLEMPIDSRPFSVGVQRTAGPDPVEKAVMWALVNPKAAKVPVHFIAVPTGGQLELDWFNTYFDQGRVVMQADLSEGHVGTFQIEGGLVFHLFRTKVSAVNTQEKA
jgi:hypothetical protein